MASALVQLDPDGTAKGTPGVLNYNVPDAISYPGRHFIAFDFPHSMFHTLLSDTTYFGLPGVYPPIRAANGTINFNDPANASYVKAVYEVILAMQNGFQSSKPPDLLANIFPGSNGDAILRVRGPYDRWLPDLPDEARSLRLALAPTDPIFTIVDNITTQQSGVSTIPQTLSPGPFLLKGPNGVAAPFAGVYTTKDTSEGSVAGLGPSLTSLTPYRVVDESIQKRRLVIYRDVEGLLACKFVPFSTNIQWQFYLVEEYRLSSFYGNYGAGKTLKTMSLLPGEKTKLSLKTYRRSTETTKQSSSVLDAFSSQIAEDFQEAVESETTNKEAASRHDEGYVEAELTGNWGTGSAKVSGGFKGGSTSAREQMAKNVSKALQKHASTASAKRDVKVEQSSEGTTESGEETGVERDIQNVNVGNTLNFVFRQMNQEHVTLLHLTDIKVAFSNSTYGSFRAVPLHQIEDFIRDYMPNADTEYVKTDDFSKTYVGATPPAGYKKKLDLVRDLILTEASSVPDWKGVLTQAVEKVSFPWSAPTTALWGGTTGATATRYQTDVSDLVKKYTGAAPLEPATQPTLASAVDFYRFKRQTSTYSLGANVLKVPGVIVAVSRNVLRTDGVIVDSLLGIGDALDVYSHNLQDEATRGKTNAAVTLEVQVALETLKQSIVSNKDSVSAALVDKMFPTPNP